MMVQGAAWYDRQGWWWAGCAGAVMMVVWLGPPAEAAYQAKGKRDPFVPLLTSGGQRLHPPGVDEEDVAAGLQSVVLQGIVYDPKTESYAIVNGRLVRVGEAIDGMTVTAIEPTTVTLLVNGQSHQLTVRSSSTEETTTSP